MIRGSSKAERKRAEETKRQRWNMFDCFCPISLVDRPIFGRLFLEHGWNQSVNGASRDWTGQPAFQPANRLIRDHLRPISHFGHDWPVKRRTNRTGSDSLASLDGCGRVSRHSGSVMMRCAPKLRLSQEARDDLERFSRSRTLSARLVERARIILRAAVGQENQQIADELGLCRQTVGRWRERFAVAQIDGLEDRP